MRRACVLLSVALVACGAPVAPPDAGGADAATPVDGGAVDAGPDAGVNDAGAADAGEPDAGAAPDAGFTGAWVYVGGSSGRIDVFSLDPATGALTPRASVDAGPNPSFLAFHPSERWLYAVNEGNPGALVAFSVGLDGGLTQLNRGTSSGSGPAHVAVDRLGRCVFAANYGGGQVAVVAIADAGALGATTDVEMPGTNPHLVATSPDDRFVFVPCKGSDRVAQFRFDADAGTLTPNTPASVATAAGAGPRHLAVHPGGRFAFLINELDSTLTSFSLGANGTLTPIETKSTLPAGFMGSNTGAHLALHPSGQLVYGSNRGDDSIVAFRIDQQGGTLALVGHVKTGGRTPRAFGLTPDGRWLFAANQGSGSVFAFRVDAVTGALTNVGQVATVASPAFVGVAPWR